MAFLGLRRGRVHFRAMRIDQRSHLLMPAAIVIPAYNEGSDDPRPRGAVARQYARW